MLFLKTALLGFLLLWSAFVAADQMYKRAPVQAELERSVEAGSLERWRASEARKKRKGNASLAIIPNLPSLPPSVERLAYERSLPVERNLPVAIPIDEQQIQPPQKFVLAAATSNARAAQRSSEKPVRNRKIIKRQHVRERPQDHMPIVTFVGFDNAFARW